MSLAPRFAARTSAVSPRSSATATSAPRSARRPATSSWPRSHASASAVSPEALRWSRLQSASISASATSAWPLPAAHSSADAPRLSTASWRASFSRSIATASSWPPAAAMMSAVHPAQSAASTSAPESIISSTSSSSPSRAAASSAALSCSSSSCSSAVRPARACRRRRLGRSLPLHPLRLEVDGLVHVAPPLEPDRVAPLGEERVARGRRLVGGRLLVVVGHRVLGYLRRQVRREQREVRHREFLANRFSIDFLNIGRFSVECDSSRGVSRSV